MPQRSSLMERLTGRAVPFAALPATHSAQVDLSSLPGCTVVYIYPRTSPADGKAIPGWADIPGAKGCTPQSCGYRDHHAELLKAGANRVFGLSSQTTDYQREAIERLHLPFQLLSDEDGKLRDSLQLPTFTAAGMTLLERFAMVIDDGIISQVFHPITDPARNAEDVLRYLMSRS